MVAYPKALEGRRAAEAGAAKRQAAGVAGASAGGRLKDARISSAKSKRMMCVVRLVRNRGALVPLIHKRGPG